MVEKKADAGRGVRGDPKKASAFSAVKKHGFSQVLKTAQENLIGTTTKTSWPSKKGGHQTSGWRVWAVGQRGIKGRHGGPRNKRLAKMEGRMKGCLKDRQLGDVKSSSGGMAGQEKEEAKLADIASDPLCR